MIQQLFTELIEYLDENYINYKILDNQEEFLIQIDDKVYQLFEPLKWEEEDRGSFFDGDFNWICDQTEYDYYVYRFGSVWYRLEKGQEKNVKLDRLKWIGKAKYEDELFCINIFLGIHGPFEFMNGMNLYDWWCKKAKFLGFTSLGICEKNTLAAALKFQYACQKSGLRSIQGMEIEIGDEEKDIKYTVKAFCKNNIGWKNLLYFNKILNVDRRLVTEQEIKENAGGLVWIWDPKTIAFDKIASSMKKLIRYYELDTVEYSKDERDEWYLKNLKKFYNSDLEPVAMSDAYCIEKEWQPIREKLNVLGKKVVHESENQYFKNCQEYFIELQSLFKDDNALFDTFQRALKNLEDISFECNFVIETQIRHMPEYTMTKEESEQYSSNLEMFEDLVFKGLEEHKDDVLDKYPIEVLEERLQREMKVIEDGEVVDYFLELRDILNWAKDNGVLLGSGRGSVCGCLISYLLGLNYINPLDYNLLFERFLTAGRLMRHDKVEEVIINEDNSNPIVLETSQFVRILREGNKMIIKVGDLIEGDELVDY